MFKSQGIYHADSLFFFLRSQKNFYFVFSYARFYFFYSTTTKIMKNQDNQQTANFTEFHRELISRFLEYMAQESQHMKIDIDRGVGGPQTLGEFYENFRQIFIRFTKQDISDDKKGKQIIQKLWGASKGECIGIIDKVANQQEPKNQKAPTFNSTDDSLKNVLINLSSTLNNFNHNIERIQERHHFQDVLNQMQISNQKIMSMGHGYFNPYNPLGPVVLPQMPGQFKQQIPLSQNQTPQQSQNMPQNQPQNQPPMFQTKNGNQLFPQQLPTPFQQINQDKPVQGNENIIQHIIEDSLSKNESPPSFDNKKGAPSFDNKKGAPSFDQTSEFQKMLQQMASPEDQATTLPNGRSKKVNGISLKSKGIHKQKSLIITNKKPLSSESPTPFPISKLDPTDSERQIFRDCLISHCLSNNISASDLHPTLDFFHTMASLIKPCIPSWSHMDEYSPKKYKAHYVMHYTLANFLKNRKRLQQLIDEAQPNRRKKELEKQLKQIKQKERELEKGFGESVKGEKYQEQACGKNSFDNGEVVPLQSNAYYQILLTSIFHPFFHILVSTNSIFDIQKSPDLRIVY